MTRTIGILAQVCGWLFVLTAFLSPLLGLALVLAPPRALLFERGFVPVTASLFLLPLVLVSLAIAFVHGGGFLRRGRTRHGRCRRCGYDIRGGGSRCPECGMSL